MFFAHFSVRKNHKRMDFILASLTAKPYNYKSCHKLLLLAQTLRIYGDDRVKRDGEVFIVSYLNIVTRKFY